MTVDSSDGVTVAVHHLADAPGRPRLLISHATGFHGLAYRPVATALGGRCDVWGHDHRGHGATPAPRGWILDWKGFGDDTTAVATALTDGDSALYGFGHSMGGASLLIAARRHPGLFAGLVLYEPIATPAEVVAGIDPETVPIVVGARRRRAQFDSLADALANYASKPPMDAFDPAALADYVEGGFGPVDADRPDGPVRLRCDPQFEADTFVAGFYSGLWELLSEIETPTVVIGGMPDENDRPSLLAPLIADRLPRGEFQEHRELDHFGPFTHPGAVASLVAEALEPAVTEDRDTPHVR